MQEREIDKSRMTMRDDHTRIREIESWFRYEYVDRLNRIERFRYLGLPLPETRWDLEHEAYEKENELRRLKGISPLPELKFRDVL
jgi:hypothetical protein